MKINDDFIVSIDVIDEDPSFSIRGCDNCNNGLGNDVYRCNAYPTDMSDHYEVQLCHECIIAREYGEELDENCRNIYQI